MKRILIFFASIFCICAVVSAADKDAAPKPLVVHEWGTFTWLQDEKGSAIGGINTDDEPVPEFVHRLCPNLLLQVDRPDPYAELRQGLPSDHPDVTMRMETPVIYFYPPEGWKPQPVDVHVTFKGGWITEFYPCAEAKAPGLDAQHPDRVYPEDWDPGKSPASTIGYMTYMTEGELAWKGLTLNTPGTGPKTEAKVWLAPRAVDSARVKTGRGETEQFLFYRGVAHAGAGLNISRNKTGDSLEIRMWRAMVASNGGADADAFRVPAAWLVDVRPDGTCAFRSLGEMRYAKQPMGQYDPSVTTPATFDAKQYSGENMAKLRGKMYDALVKAGLFPDEAEALLNTWEVSYFKSPGLRFFYLLPRAETDERLPLQISVPANVTRVVVGRIELVTPEQRTLLAKIAAGPAPDMSAARAAMEKKGSEFFAHPENTANWNDAITGKKPFSALGVEIPELYADYLKLGRFRNALVLNEQMLRPTPALNDFISKNKLEAYKVADSEPPNQSNATNP